MGANKKRSIKYQEDIVRHISINKICDMKKLNINGEDVFFTIDVNRSIGYVGVDAYIVTDAGVEHADVFFSQSPDEINELLGNMDKLQDRTLLNRVLGIAYLSELYFQKLS